MSLTFWWRKVVIDVRPDGRPQPPGGVDERLLPCDVILGVVGKPLVVQLGPCDVVVSLKVYNFK